MAVPFRPSFGAVRARVLHICPACGSRLVQSESWSHPEPERWVIGLRCPECSFTETGEFGWHQVEAFLDQSDRALAELHVLAERMNRERFQAQVAVFIEALRVDAIEPMDF
jgi:hypothetical protein